MGKENLIGCDLEACKATNCPDGSIAPILPGNCCPDTSLCPAKNCAAIGCLVELCPNGQMPPVPPGRCCPSAPLCPREDCPSTCPQAICPDGRTAPTPAGKCCPDPFLCDQERECARKEEFCKPEFCPNGDLAPCNTVRAYLVLQRDVPPEILLRSLGTHAAQARLSATTRTALRFVALSRGAATAQ